MIRSASDPGTADPAASTRESEWYRQLHEAHGRLILAYFLRRADREAAHDLFADVLLIAWRRRLVVPTAADDQRVWLLRVSRNVLRNDLRQRARRGRLVDRLARQRDPGDGGHADAVICDVELRRAIAGLRASDREVLRLAAWEDCAPAEIARIVGCSPNAAAIRLHRARRRLRAALDRQVGEHPRRERS